MYFNNCTTLDELKNEFRKQCFKLHPDQGGKASDFIKMREEFKKLSNVLKHKTGFETDKNFDSDKFYNIVKLFETLEDIKISFVGSFIWLEDLRNGAMYEQKDQIKAIILEAYNSARWAGKKKSWYYSPKDYKQKFSKNKSLDQIKATYGSKSFNSKGTLKLS